jgi:hypothetical protein
MMVPLLFVLASCSEEEVKNVDTNLSASVETRGACGFGAGEVCLSTGQTFNGTYMYQGCAIPFTATYYICPQGIQMNPVVWDYNNLPNTPDCDKLKRRLDYLWSIRDELSIMNLINAITIGMTNQAQSTIFTIVQTLDPGIYQCSNVPVQPCESQQFIYTYVTRTVNCTQVCGNYTPNGEDGGKWNLAVFPCGQACCVRSSHFCMNPDGTICYGPVVYSQSVCSLNRPCPQGWTGSGTCSTQPCSF